jgi:neutral amino acid transport system ATP-binding protein
MAGEALAGLEPRPGVPKPSALLAAEGVKRSFGGLMAVDVEHLEVQRGAITALIGPNGAGKSTFFNVLSGFDRADAGSWSFEGRDVSRLPAHSVARRGLVRTFQLTKALSRLTVLENVMLGGMGQTGEQLRTCLFPSRWGRQEAAVEDRAVQLLERFGLADHRDSYAGVLSGGQRKLLEMARALMSDPVMIMLDEPMAGVNPALVESLLGRIREFAREGMSVLFVEHNMDVVMGISDWVVCMAVGRVVAEGPPAHVRADPVVVDAYLGATHAQVADG